MNVDATETELRDIAETLKFAAILDDRAPRADKARIAAWAEQIHRHNLHRDDLLNGLQKFYDEPRDRAIGIGDLISLGRHCKRDRVEREAEQSRESRQSEFDRKADADDAHTISAAFIGGRVKPTPRLETAREGLQTCHGRAESLDAITEFFDAKRDAAKSDKP